jgi:hypothetical protein
LLVAPPLIIQASEPLSATQLRNSCSAYMQARDGVEGLLCESYIRGFVDGITAFEGTGTRLIPASHGHSFCLRSPVSIEHVIARVVSTADALAAGPRLSAAQLVDRTLQQLYPC